MAVSSFGGIFLTIVVLLVTAGCRVRCEDLADCLRTQCDHNRQDLTSTHTLKCSKIIDSISYAYDSPCNDLVFSIQVNNLTMDQIDSLGVLGKLKNLYGMSILNTNPTAITKSKFLEKTLVREFELSKSSGSVESTLGNHWTMFKNVSMVAMRACHEDKIEYFDPATFAPYGQTINTTAYYVSDDYREDDRELTSYEQCVKEFCTKPSRQFECANGRKYYTIKKVDDKYTKCLSIVTYMSLPPNTNRFEDDAFDQFPALVYLELQNVNTFAQLSICTLSSLDNLRIIDFTETNFQNIKETIAENLFAALPNLIKITFSTMTAYRECSIMHLIKANEQEQKIIEGNICSHAHTYTMILFAVGVFAMIGLTFVCYVRRCLCFSRQRKRQS